MAIFLSFLTAISFGVADYSGGTASKRASAFQVLAISHGFGLLLVIVGAAIWRSPFTWFDFGVGSAAGVFGGIGIVLFYRALSRGAMALATPIAAIISAVIPALWSAFTGEGLAPIVWFGIALAIVAIGLVSKAKEEVSTSVGALLLAESLGAGLFFGIFFIVLDFASSESAPWPIVGSRVMTGVLLTSVLTLMGRLQLRKLVATAPKSLFGFIFMAGALDTLANVLFLIASDLGNLAIVSVITAMYPVVTVALARFVDHESLQRVQVIGIVLVIVATILIVGGQARHDDLQLGRYLSSLYGTLLSGTWSSGTSLGSFELAVLSLMP